MLGDEELFFEEEDEINLSNDDKAPVKVLVVDDEKEVHAVTRMVLKDYMFESRGLEIFGAYSGHEARQMILEHPDIALTLLDVVMEEDDAGLKFIKYIREELGNRFMRIILRTGQPGQAPERKVVAEYDINDYKEKGELTAQKLFTTITASLRSYEHLKTIEQNRRGLEQIITAVTTIYGRQSYNKLISKVLNQLISILNIEEDSEKGTVEGFAVSNLDGTFFIHTGTDEFKEFIGKRMDSLPAHHLQHLLQAINTRQSIFSRNNYVGFFCENSGPENLILIQCQYKMSDLCQNLIRIFSTNVSAAFDNMYLNREIEETQKEVLLTLGEMVESRSMEVGFHVKRVAAYSHLLALKAGLDGEQAELLKLASPMHDVGKLGITDALLEKPEKLTEEEFEAMKNHTTYGYEILKGSNRKILKAAAIIALQHHESWDGSGYPQGLKGEEIHIFGRIIRIFDVFDALISQRVYKGAWGLDRVWNYLKEKRGKLFDPRLIDLYFENLEEFLVIQQTYPVFVKQ